MLLRYPSPNSWALIGRARCRIALPRLAFNSPVCTPTRQLPTVRSFMLKACCIGIGSHFASLHLDQFPCWSARWRLHCEPITPRVPLHPSVDQQPPLGGALYSDKISTPVLDGQEQLKTYSWLQLLRTAISTKLDWLLLGAVACTAIAAAAVNLITPRIIGGLVNILSENLRLQQTTIISAVASISAQFYKPAISLLGLFGAQGALTFLYIYLVSVLGERVACGLRSKLFKSIVEQDIEFFDENRTGELVSRVTNDVSEFKHAFKQTISQGLKSVSQVIGSAWQLFQISSRLTGYLAVSVPFLYGCGNLYGAYLRALSARAKSKEGVAAAIAGESLSNIRTVRSFSNEDFESDQYSKALEEAREANEKLAFHIGIFQGFTNFSIGSMVLTVLYFGGDMVANSSMTAGDLMSYLISVQAAQKSLVGVLFAQSIKSLSAFGRIQEYMSIRPKIPIKGGMIPETDEIRQADIEFRNVTFSYPHRPNHLILEKFSLTIPRGKVVALCGASGSGKSTIAALLERFYDTDSGDILIGNHSIKQLDPSAWRRSVGYINQEPILFATTILENVRYASPNASLDRVENVLEMANARQFIEQFPEGLQTTVGERGAMLSGGQKQRISIARALLKQPAILILDEATSALDAHSERLVQDALDKAMQGLTVLIIAHRLSTIQKADLIVLLGKGGRILEQGTHEELMAKQGDYYTLYSSAKSPDLMGESSESG